MHSRQRIRKALEATRRFIAPGGKAFRNEAGDLVVQSQDGMRQVRFDFNNPSPHQHPHMHVIQYRQVKNSKSEVVNEQIWPSDAPNN